MACPALPLCPLAITEAERGIPEILKRVRAVFDKVITLFILHFIVIICKLSYVKIFEWTVIWEHFIAGWPQVQ